MREHQGSVETGRPAEITALARLANIAGVFYLFVVALVVFYELPTSPWLIGMVLFLTAYGISRLWASYGLLCMKRSGWLLELGADVIFLLAVLGFLPFVLMRKLPLILLGPLAPGAILSVYSIMVLRRLKPRFAGRGEPGYPASRKRTFAWFATQAAVLALLLGFVAPNLAGDLPKGNRQKRTMALMRDIATAVEAYATDYNQYPVAPNLNELIPQLSPIYIKNPPRVDGWNTEFRFYTWSEDPNDPTPQRYVVISAAKDRKFEAERLRDYAGGPTTNFDCDIVFSNGEFVQYPEGVQH